MNPSGSDGWRGNPGGAQSNHPSMDHSGQPPLRQLGGFGPNAPQSGPSQGPGPILPPPSSHYSSSQSNQHSLPHLAELTHGPSGQHQPPPYAQHPPPGSAHGLPGMGSGMQHSPPGALSRDRERDMREHELREREMMDRERHQREEMLLREREREREMDRQRDMPQHQQHPVQSHTGSIPIHQPVASKISNNIHGPNGLLSNLGSGQAQNAPPSLQVGSGPGGLFGSAPQQAPEGTPRPYMHQPVQAPPQQSMVFGGAGPSPMPGNGPAMAQGQQPILNDALSYLDQVKVRFSDQPDVYNRFLDIMKDFKSQAIDTPGVIERVSTLFNGHPALIQGFNTFLPPGYRIECGTDDNPDAIRVTTPSGTMTQNLPRPRPYEASNLGPGAPQPMGRQDAFDQGRGFLSQQQGSSAPMPSYSPGARPASLAVYGAQPDGGSSYGPRQDQESAAANAALVHQQEQRGVSQLQNAISAATNGSGRTQVLPVSPEPVAGPPGTQTDIKRGPVEFNHAISYVNKIKNRFAQQPEIYKQFLEILQTYQRESKPIQDVYSQVTQLFNTAPDLLEDFKQFLPESAAAAKAQAAARAGAMSDEPAISNVRGEPGYGSNQIVQAQTPRPTAKMPPMGQFDPPSTSKENKKRRNGAGAQSFQASSAGDTVGLGSGGNNASRQAPVQVGNATKRTKIHHTTKPQQVEQPAASPTLIPALPEPLPPANLLSATQDEFAFFDRVRKVVGNKGSYTEFLKLVNLFTQDLIDKHVMFDRLDRFIGSHPDLLNWFATFIGIQPQEEVMEPKVDAPDTGRVNLSYCRALGPSYRKLPDQEQRKTCKGRDEIAASVLNDEWVSHPTWASEDSGFVAHRKNAYEDALHRLEEERHDYDYNIETCQRTIQLMEPLVQQISLMTDAERANFVLVPGLGGHSIAIYTRVIKKVYDREKGQIVLDSMFEHPTAVLPVVLKRLKQKLEEWKAGQREWEKIWREQTNRIYWRSLDHQGLIVKNNDKKIFTPKYLLSEISAKYEERKKIVESGVQMPKHQLEYLFNDPEVICDACHMLLVYTHSAQSGIAASDQERIATLLKDFIPVFFQTERIPFLEYMEDVKAYKPEKADQADDIAAPKPRVANMKKGELLRRGLVDSRNGKEGSVLSGSKESTPAPVPSDFDADDIQAAPDVVADVAERRWMEHPRIGNVSGHRKLNLDEPTERHSYSLYANNNIYVFFRLFEILYSRLLAIKENEAAVHESVARAIGDPQKPKAGIILKMIDKMPADFWKEIGPKANYYKQIIGFCEDVVIGEMDLGQLEETLRRYYVNCGWQLYTIDKLVSNTVKAVHVILGSDPKDKSTDIINLFFKDREKDDTTYAQELQYRKHVQRLIKDGEAYLINFDPSNMKSEIRYFPADEVTFEADDLNEVARWSYYVSAFSMMEPTEGIPWSKVKTPFLTRNLPTHDIEWDDAYGEIMESIESKEDFQTRVTPDSYQLHFTGYNYLWRKDRYLKPAKETDEATIGEEAGETATEKRNAKFEDLFVRNTVWMKDRSGEEVDRMKTQWQKWINNGPQEVAAVSGDDVQMGDA